jgi:micrococcal nuclease
MMLKPLVAVVILAAACSDAPADGPDPPAPDGPTGTVVALHDGDSVRVALRGATDEIRLRGVNAPESDECWADEARTALEDLTEGEVVVVSEGQDQFGRTLAHLYSEGRSVNQALVEAGAAIALTSDDSDFAAAENLAFSARVGMWSPTACGPASEEEVHIAEVFFDAPGPDDENPNGEFVVIANDGPEVDLTGWMIRDESSTHRFEFPDGFAVGTGESVVIRSGCGQDGPSELFWCANGAVWNNGGDMALLLDAYGNVVDRWRYQGSR